MRILITGSRDWPLIEAPEIARQLYDYLERTLQLGGQFVLVHGANPRGVDKIAQQWAEEWPAAVNVEQHPADWKMGQQAGMWRNTHMVNLGADLCLAFIMPCNKSNCRIEGPHGSHGATDCRDKARAAGIRTISDERWGA